VRGLGQGHAGDRRELTSGLAAGTPTRPAQRIGDIVAGKRAITADTDLRLCRFFGLSNGYWLRAQAAYDTEVAERALGAKLAKIKPWARSKILEVAS